jgi:hypothetical protein
LSPQERGMCIGVHSSLKTAEAICSFRLQSHRFQFSCDFTDCYFVFKFGQIIDVEHRGGNRFGLIAFDDAYPFWFE